MVKIIEELKGKVITNIDVIDNEEIYFELENGEKYRMYHEQDCCECVSIEDICGNLDNLLNTPIINAEEVSNIEEITVKNDEYMLQRWTFYKFVTKKGYVDIRWYGESNGYYAVSVDIVKIN